MVSQEWSSAARYISARVERPGRRRPVENPTQQPRVRAARQRTGHEADVKSIDRRVVLVNDALFSTTGREQK